MAIVTISLPDQIAKKVDSEARQQGFATRSEFIRNLIRKHFTQANELEFQEFEEVPLEQLRLELARTGKYSEEFIESVIEGLTKSSAYED